MEPDYLKLRQQIESLQHRAAHYRAKLEEVELGKYDKSMMPLFEKEVNDAISEIIRLSKIAPGANQSEIAVAVANAKKTVAS